MTFFLRRSIFLPGWSLFINQEVQEIIPLVKSIPMGNILEYPHRRLNPLTGEWVLVSPHRARRPWLGQVEELPPESLPYYDPDCCLCPGNTRAGSRRNPPFTHTFVVDNDYAALLPETAEAAIMGSTLSPFFLLSSSRSFTAGTVSDPRKRSRSSPVSQ